jgi:ribA/ribD-fused uncharacterized protein
MRSLDDVIAAMQAGQQLDYLFFWGHSQKTPGVIDKSCFSQWFPAAFTQDGQLYRTAEHYMMAQKAALFDDHVAFAKILAADGPKDAKSLGRKVKGFDEARWVEHRWEIVVQANQLKFQQNPELGHVLLATAPKVLVEASPVDTIWGIGLAQSAPTILDPSTWRGLNLLGFALMEVRDRLSYHPDFRS